MILTAFFGGQHILELRAEEPRRALVTLEMVLNNNYLIPKINEWPYYNKPPLFNWVQAGFFNLFNSYSEWVARLPSLLSFIGMAFLAFRISFLYMDREKAKLVGLMTLTSADLIFYGSVNSGEIDLFYSMIVFIQVISIFYYGEKKKWMTMFLVSYLCMAIGFLTKGPPSIAFQALTLIAWLGYRKNMLKLLSWQHILGILFSTSILGIYFMIYHQYLDAYDLIGRLFAEASQKSGLESGITDTLINIFMFPISLIKIMLPWSLIILFFRWPVFKNQINGNPLIAFSTIFIVSNIWLYWITGESKARYIYMFVPFFIIILTGLYDNRRLLYGLVIMLLVARVIYNFTYLPLQNKSYVKEYKSVSEKIHSLTKDHDLFLYGTPHQVKSQIKIGPVILYDNVLEVAPLFAYQYNYNLTRKRTKTLEFKNKMDASGFYITPLHLVNTKEDSIVYTFFENWQKMERAVVYVK